jgi:hypothetical protein
LVFLQALVGCHLQQASIILSSLVAVVAVVVQPVHLVRAVVVELAAIEHRQVLQSLDLSP